MASTGLADSAETELISEERTPWYQTFPWWLVAIAAFLAYMAVQIGQSVDYREAFNFLLAGSKDGFAGKEYDGLWDFFVNSDGIILTIRVTLIAFVLSMILGLMAGLGRISSNFVFRNIATTYIEVVRGIPVLVLLLVFGFSIFPDITEWLVDSRSALAMEYRGALTLSVIYGAFVAEVFRAGIESVPKGQMEAARSVGMTHYQAMRHIILPQAIRNILPALGNDFIALLKDSSLVSALAVSDITQLSRLYVGSTFRFREAYLVLTFMYLAMTIALSLLQRWYARRVGLTQTH